MLRNSGGPAKKNTQVERLEMSARKKKEQKASNLLTGFMALHGCGSGKKKSSSQKDQLHLSQSLPASRFAHCPERQLFQRCWPCGWTATWVWNLEWCKLIVPADYHGTPKAIQFSRTFLLEEPLLRSILICKGASLRECMASLRPEHPLAC